MKKVCAIIFLAIILGIFFGLKGVPTITLYLNEIGFLNWLSANEWLIDLLIFAPLVVIFSYYISYNSKKGESHEKKRKTGR
ncbi:MAG: hypothetical protein ACD_14C00018G0002 [uncultured bacterium]|nr:MAG: hypothetical protein ACD_14C00018G0002 [uncultured bacterium]KKQ45197.1 MAG: hypothetical protein US63_C0020G0021 [Candidatus Moranbacteria bacterium GW2011_GWC2_37_8]KKQ60963.1 MAG: hypothetical protein US82_C0026G0022 [Parcubacteria group bacterium GW2011_GWC1_38_22]